MKTLSAKGFLRDWMQDPGPRGTAANLVMMQMEDYEKRIDELEAALRQYLDAKPQCSCTDPACKMQAARLKAMALLR